MIRVGLRFLLAIMTLLLVAFVGSGFATKSAKPVMLREHWRAVASGLIALVASDRYVAIDHGYGTAQLTLIDERTRRQRMLYPPTSCPGLSDHFDDQLLIGGPWLYVVCSNTDPPYSSAYLYNLERGQWSGFSVSPQCPGICKPVAIGRYWVKIESDDGAAMQYVPTDYYVQKISTGQLVHDSASPSGTVFDDLNAPSGSSHLCSPLRYPQLVDLHGGAVYLGSISFYRRFAVTLGSERIGDPPVYRLRRCGSRLNLLVDSPFSPVTPSGPVASLRAVVSTPDGKTLLGWSLPGLRRFNIIPPAATQRPCPTTTPPAATPEQNWVAPVAVTDRRLYVEAMCSGELWAATLALPTVR